MRVDEIEGVQAWREEKLLEAGYPADMVRVLAARGDIDLQVACDLLAHGCDPLIAIDILL